MADLSTADAPAVERDELARELEKLKRTIFGLRDDMARQRVEMQLMRQDVAAVYGLARLLVDRQP
jgi:ribosomal protein L29